MKVFFINPPFKSEYGKFSRESRSPAIGHSGVLYYPLWLIYSAAVIEKAGFDLAFLDAPSTRMSVEESLNYIDENAENTKLFIIDTSTPSIYSDISFAGKIKNRYPNSFVLLVGTHPSSTAEETIRIDERIDGIARKEYDYIVRDLACAIESGSSLATIKGLTYRSFGKVIHNADAEYIFDLDEIPFASEFIHKHLNCTNYSFPAAQFPSIQIFTGRGCPARCNFCVYPQTMHGHKYRLRSIQNVVDEFKYIVDNMPQVKEIVIEDDTFTVNKERVIEFCSLLVRDNLHKRIRWLCNARVNLDLETMKLMKKAGCHLIIPGIESMNQTILNNIKKGTTVDQIEEYLKNARKAGLLVHACYMVGNRGETKETMEETLRAALKFTTDTAQFFPLVPYPGTEAYEWAKSNGYINGRYDQYCNEDGTINCVINLPELPAEELLDFCAQARKKYYLRPRYLFYKLWRGMRDFEDFKRSLKAFMILKNSLFRSKKGHRYV